MPTPPQLNHLTHRNLINAVLLLGGVLLPILFLPIGFDVKDEFYQALSVRDYTNAPLAPLSFYIGNIWCRIFGETIVNLRILSSLFASTGIAIGCLYLYRKCNCTRLCCLTFLIMNLGTNLSTRIYNWDVGSVPFLMMALVSILLYWEKTQ